MLDCRPGTTYNTPHTTNNHVAVCGLLLVVCSARLAFADSPRRGCSIAARALHTTHHIQQTITSLFVDCCWLFVVPVWLLLIPLAGDARLPPGHYLQHTTYNKQS